MTTQGPGPDHPQPLAVTPQQPYPQQPYAQPAPSAWSQSAPPQHPVAPSGPPPRTRLPGWAIVVMILGGLLIVVLLGAVGNKGLNTSASNAGAAPAYGSSTSSSSSQLPPGALGVMPDYRGQNAGAAATDLQRFGVYLSYTPAQAAGVVGNQTPAPGTVIYPGSNVVIYPYSTTTTAAAPPNPNGPFSAGTYLVSSEVTPGSYRTDGQGAGCYWARLRNTSGDFSAIITNGIVSGPTTMTVSSSDGAVTFSGDCTWTRR